MKGLAREGINLPDIQAAGQYFGSAAAFEEDLRPRFIYRPEHEEVIRTMPYMLEEIQRTGTLEGDCDDISVFAAAMLRAMGYTARFVAIRYGGNPNFSHVFVEYASLGDYQRMDLTTAPGTVHQEDERMVEYV